MPSKKKWSEELGEEEPKEEFRGRKKFAKGLGHQVKRVAKVVVVKPARWGKEVIKAGAIEPAKESFRENISEAPQKIRRWWREPQIAKEEYKKSYVEGLKEAAKIRAKAEAGKKYKVRLVPEKKLEPERKYPQQIVYRQRGKYFVVRQPPMRVTVPRVRPVPAVSQASSRSPYSIPGFNMKQVMQGVSDDTNLDLRRMLGRR